MTRKTDYLRRIMTACLMATCIINSLSAENAELELDIVGTVYDVNDNSPLPGATIYIEELEKGVITDTEGIFRITGVPDGTYTLKAQFIGYRPSEKTVTTDKGRRSNDIGLKPEAQSLSEVMTYEYRPRTNCWATAPTLHHPSSLCLSGT